MTNAEILNNVALIRDAENPGENSAQRVGSTLEGIAQLAINNEKKIKTLEDNENSTQDSIDILNGYFTSNQGENGKPSINRWNIPYYLNEAMVWGGDINKERKVTISDAMRSKNSINQGITEFKINGNNYQNFKNVYFTVTEDLNFNEEYLTKGDIIISTGTKWVTLISTHPRNEITHTNADSIVFDFYRNDDEFVHYIFDKQNAKYTFDVSCDKGENNRMAFYVLVTNNSTGDITFNLPYNQVLVIPQGKERYFEARIIDGRYVFAFPPLSDTESNISINGDITTIKNDTNTLKSYFTSTEGGTDDNPTAQNASINRWNLPFYLLNALIYGGEISKGDSHAVVKVSLSAGLISKNKYKVTESTMSYSEPAISFKNVYFYIAETVHFNYHQYHKGDLVISDGTNWRPIQNGNLIKHTNSPNSEIVEFNMSENIDEHIKVAFDSTHAFTVCEFIPLINDNSSFEPCKNAHFYITNQSTNNITLKFYKDSTNYDFVIIKPNADIRVTARVFDSKIVYSETYKLGEINQLYDSQNEIKDKIQELTTSKTAPNTITVDSIDKTFILNKKVISLSDSDAHPYWKYQFICATDGVVTINITSKINNIKKRVIFEALGDEGSDKNSIEVNDWTACTPITGSKITIEKILNKIIITHNYYTNN